MNRKVLLIEPNYKNKYPPMGLMKIATYYRQHGDDVRFYKGDMKLLAVELICEDLINHLEILYPDTFWKDYYPILFDFIKLGKYSILDANEIFSDEDIREAVKEYRNKYRNKEYFTNPKFDKVGITTLFTFGWKITIETINFAKQLCKNINDVMVGGIMSSMLPDEVYKATGIHPHVGLLNQPGDIDEGDPTIIDELPLDYSILEEIDYKYPARLLNEHEYVEFLVGRDGEFDQLVTSATLRCRKRLDTANYSVIWVMPYLKSDYIKNRESYDSYYDSVEVYELSANAHPKSAIQICNRAMVDRSDLCVFYVTHKGGGAYQTLRYAEKADANIINLCE